MQVIALPGRVPFQTRPTLWLLTADFCFVFMVYVYLHVGLFVSSALSYFPILPLIKPTKNVAGHVFVEVLSFKINKRNSDNVCQNFKGNQLLVFDRSGDYGNVEGIRLHR